METNNYTNPNNPNNYKARDLRYVYGDLGALDADDNVREAIHAAWLSHSAVEMFRGTDGEFAHAGRVDRLHDEAGDVSALTGRTIDAVLRAFEAVA